MQQRRRFVFFASAAVAADSSRITASSSASWSGFSPPSDFVNGHVSTMWFMVCRSLAIITGRWLGETTFLCKLSRRRWYRSERQADITAASRSWPAAAARGRLDVDLIVSCCQLPTRPPTLAVLSTDSIRLITQSHKALRAGWAPVFGVCCFRLYIHTNIHIRH